MKDATFDKATGLWTVNIENGKSFTVSESIFDQTK